MSDENIRIGFSYYGKETRWALTSAIVAWWLITSGPQPVLFSIRSLLRGQLEDQLWLPKWSLSSTQVEGRLWFTDWFVRLNSIRARFIL